MRAKKKHKKLNWKEILENDCNSSRQEWRKSKRRAQKTIRKRSKIFMNRQILCVLFLVSSPLVSVAPSVYRISVWIENSSKSSLFIVSKCAFNHSKHDQVLNGQNIFGNKIREIVFKIKVYHIEVKTRYRMKKRKRKKKLHAYKRMILFVQKKKKRMNRKAHAWKKRAR